MHPILEHAFYTNHWLWVHCLGGLFLCALFLKAQMSKQKAFVYVLLIAIGWEIVEAFIYKSWAVKEFWLDSGGDIAGAMLAALICVLFWKDCFYE